MLLVTIVHFLDSTPGDEFASGALIECKPSKKDEKSWVINLRGYGAIGSASDSRSEGWEFDSLWPQLFLFVNALRFDWENR